MNSLQVKINLNEKQAIFHNKNNSVRRMTLFYIKKNLCSSLEIKPVTDEVVRKMKMTFIAF